MIQVLIVELPKQDNLELKVNFAIPKYKKVQGTSLSACALQFVMACSV